MINRYRLLTIATAILPLYATDARAAASARQPVVTSADPGSIVAGFTAAGYTARLDKDQDGDPWVAVTGPTGGGYAIFFYGCQNHAACQQIQFRATYSNLPVNPTLMRRINDWNAQSNFLHASSLADGKIAIDAKLQLVPGGIGQPLFAAIVRGWSGDTDKFYAFVTAPGK